MDKKLNISVDFDGVLHQYISKWTNEFTIADPPYPGAIEWLRSLLGAFNVYIFSMRCARKEGITAMRFWLSGYGITNEELIQINFSSEKVKAHLYIDDRAFCFKGTFPTAEEISAFKPHRYSP
jgi:5'(3')-deoxyribonucleotidase